MEIWAENPLLGTNSVIRLPIVPVILLPTNSTPKTSPIAPIYLISTLVPVPKAKYITPVAAAISIAPTFKAAKLELPI